MFSVIKLPKENTVMSTDVKSIKLFQFKKQILMVFEAIPIVETVKGAVTDNE